MLAKTLTAATALFLATMAGQAHAATFTYNFTGSTTAYSLSKNFTVSGAPDLTVTANTVATDGSTVTPVTGSGVGVGQWSGLGLGLLNGPNDNSHTVDGSGLNDLLVLAFTSSVRFVSATFNYAGKVANSNDGFAFFANNDVDNSLAGDMIFDHNDIGAVNYTGTYNFLAKGYDYTSALFGIGAIWDAVYQQCVRYRYGQCKEWKSYTKFDSFKLASITVEYPPPQETPPEVPLPAGLVLLLSGITGLGFLNRLKSKAVT